MNLGEFLLCIIEYVTRVLPRFMIVWSTIGGVAFVRGKPVQIPSGCIYWYWPVWTDIKTGPIAPQVLDLKDQRMFMVYAGNWKEISVSAAMEYEVVDTMKAYGERYDLDESIEALALLAIEKTIGGKDLLAVISDMEAIDEELRQRMNEGLEGYGVNVMTAGLTDITTCRVLHHIGM